MPKGEWHCTSSAASNLSNLGQPRCWKPQPEDAIRVWVQRVTKPTAPGTLRLGKACQGERGTAPTLLHPHLSSLGHPSCWLPQPQCKSTMRIMVRVRVQRATKPTAPGTLQHSQSEQSAFLWKTLCA